MAPNVVNKSGNVSQFFFQPDWELHFNTGSKIETRNKLSTTVDSSPETPTGMLGKVVLSFSLAFSHITLIPT